MGFDPTASLLGRPHVFERGDRIYLTTPITLASPTAGEIEEFAFASAVKSSAPNEHIGWLSGRYVEAGRANLNNAMWLSDELALKSLTPMLMPVTVMHDPRTAVGTIADCKLIGGDGSSTAGTARIDTILAVWRHRFPEIWDEAEHNIKDGTMMQSMECVPLDSEILTRRGWRRYDEVREGDETIGFNEATGCNEWTPIVGTIRKRAELFSLHSSRWRVLCTGGHGWIARIGKRVGSRLEFGRAAKVPSRILGERHRLILSARARLGGEDRLPITPAEAALIAWVAGDGSIRSHRGAKDFQATISQSKPDGVMPLEMVLAEAGMDYTVSEREPDRAGAIKQRHAMRSYYLPVGQIRGLWLRAELDHLSWTSFVLRLSSECRTAFMQAMFDAEGNENRGARCIAQMPGPLKDAIALGGYLEGWRSVPHERGFGDNSQPNSHVRLCRATVNGGGLQMLSLGDAEVWCPTTELGSWTMRQGDQIVLTGNCLSPSYSCSECGQQYIKLHEGREQSSWCDHLRSNLSRRILSQVCFTGTGLIFGTRGGQGAYTEAYLDHFQDEIAEFHHKAHIDSSYRPSEGSASKMGFVQIDETELANLRKERDDSKRGADEKAVENRDLATKLEKAEADVTTEKTRADAAEQAKKDLEESAQRSTLKEKRIGELGQEFLGGLGEFTRARLNESASTLSDEDWDATLKEKEELIGVERAAGGPTMGVDGPTVDGPKKKKQAPAPKPDLGEAVAGSAFSDEEVASFAAKGVTTDSPAVTSGTGGVPRQLARAFQKKRQPAVPAK